MIRNTYTAILPLTDYQKHQIIMQFEEFEITGVVGDCLLRQVAETMQGCNGYVVMYMNQIAMECYRHFANLYIEGA